jgi:hypothetical protein
MSVCLDGCGSYSKDMDQEFDPLLTLPVIQKHWPDDARTPRTRNTVLDRVKRGEFPPPDAKIGSYK